MNASLQDAGANDWGIGWFSLALCCIAWIIPIGTPAAEPARETISLVVMDPLAAPLSCPCVEGYAQRKYECLAEHLQQETGRRVKLVFADSLMAARRDHQIPSPQVVIGKQSIVRADAKRLKLEMDAAYRLTDLQGATTQTGLLVVAADDPALIPSDLAGYRIFFGSADSEEKHQAAIVLLQRAGVAVAKPLETTEACSEGACRVLELGNQVRSAAVISSYAKPLLEGCGTVPKGSLRCIGQTEPVPFITLFINRGLPIELRTELQQALQSVGTNTELCKALESSKGFVPVQHTEND